METNRCGCLRVRRAKDGDQQAVDGSDAVGKQSVVTVLLEFPGNLPSVFFSRRPRKPADGWVVVDCINYSMKSLICCRPTHAMDLHDVKIGGPSKHPEIHRCLTLRRCRSAHKPPHTVIPLKIASQLRRQRLECRVLQAKGGTAVSDSHE